VDVHATREGPHLSRACTYAYAGLDVSYAGLRASDLGPVRPALISTPLSGTIENAPVARSVKALARFLSSTWLHLHTCLSVRTTSSSRRSLSSIECLREQHFTLGMLPLHTYVALWFAACTSAVVFQQRGSANRTGKIDPPKAGDFVSRVLTQPFKPPTSTALP
jgi:hypothetical protein